MYSQKYIKHKSSVCGIATPVGFTRIKLATLSGVSDQYYTRTYLYVRCDTVDDRVQLTLVSFVGPVDVHLFNGDRNERVDIGKVHVLAHIIDPHLRA